MQLTLLGGLPFISAILTYNRHEIEIPFILVDTGSASTVFSSDWGQKVGIVPEKADTIRTLWGVGGSEVVFTRRMDSIKVGQITLENFEAEFGGMEYGFQINGILGMGFLLEARAIVNLGLLSLDFAG
jgi:predicted aspartyl protease